MLYACAHNSVMCKQRACTAERVVYMAFVQLCNVILVQYCCTLYTFVGTLNRCMEDYCPRSSSCPLPLE